MANFIRFFIRIRGEFIPIASFSSMDPIYEAFEPEGSSSLERLDDDTYKSMMLGLTHQKMELEKEKFEAEKEMECISNFSNSVEEKVNALYEHKEYIKQLEEEIAQVSHSQSFVFFLNNLQNELEIFNDIEVGDAALELESYKKWVATSKEEIGEVDAQTDPYIEERLQRYAAKQPLDETGIFIGLNISRPIEKDLN